MPIVLHGFCIELGGLSSDNAIHVVDVQNDDVSEIDSSLSIPGCTVSLDVGDLYTEGIQR